MNYIKIFTFPIAFCLTATAVAEPPKTDAAGDPLPPGAVARLGSSRFTHSANVDHVAFTADGKTVVFTGRDSAFSRWDIADGRETGHFLLPQFGPRGILLSPDGATIAQGRSGGGAVVTDAATGKQRFTVQQRGNGVPVLGWGKGGQTLLVSTTNEIRVWDVAAGRELAHWNIKPAAVVPAVAGSPDGTRVAVLNEAGTVTLHDAATGKELKAISRPGAVRRGRLGGESLAFSPDGKKLLDCSSRSVYLWDVATGNHLTHLNGKNDHPFTAAWSPDGKYLATAGNDLTVRLLDANTGKEIKTIPSAVPVRALRFSPDGRFLAGVSNSPCPELWDVAAGKSLAVKTGHRGAVLGLAFPAPGRVVTGGADAHLMEWDTKTGRQVSSFGQRSGPVRSLGVGGPGILYCQAGELKAWTPGAAAAAPLPWESPGGGQGTVSADGRVFANWDDNGSIQCFETAAGKKLASIHVGDDFDPVLLLAPDGRFLAMRSFTDDSNFLRVWRTADGRLVRTITHSEEFTQGAAFAPNGRAVATLNSAGQVRVCELATGADFVVPVKSRLATAVTFSPNSRILFIGCQTGEVWAYDLVAGEASGPHAGHRAMVDALAVSPDGATLVTGSTDTTALVWDAAALRPKLPAAAPPSPDDLARWWADLSAPAGDRVRHALAGLTASPKEALPYLKAHLKPTTLPPRDRIAAWVRDLESPRFAVREKASRALAALGEDATDILNDAHAKATSAEGRRRIELLLRETDGVLSAPSLQLLRGLDVLELIADPDARAVLEDVIKTAEESWLKREARATLARMSTGGR